jgi:hypothetical protein
MLSRKSPIVLFLAVSMSFSAGCRKEEKEKTPTKAPQTMVDVRAQSACERAARKFLDAAAGKDYRLALEYVDVEEMVQKGREQAATSTATPPDDVERLKDMLVAMLEKSSTQAGQLTYAVLGSKVSGDTAVVMFEAHNKAGELVDKGDLALVKRDGKWKLSGSALRAILPRGTPAPLIKSPPAESQ